ncbi:membrane glycosyltransferase [Gemmobacter megaterium]|uniref:Glucans biosynthesis glucosyltransferase H n=1 Tax=Gemmobacter megaterium TaxID=1086013 RepID=A0A1N7N3F8_9RHOB|nr:glucans biosynthesis glucosyltransferase MdoH [Gemmobacter megaterium]GGE12892.1 glucosyltransferase [Gemmobacter megaterium]SIS92953.1 membrane glycosyltransferase [Gemmobacter megaterium]
MTAPAPGLRVIATRTLLLAASLGIGLGGFGLFMRYGAADGLDAMDWVRSSLILVSTFWLAWGAVQALAGLTTRAPRVARSEGPITARTVVLMPVYNEDPEITFARVAAIDASLQATGHGGGFDLAILSDTRDDRTAAAERQWFLRLLDETGGDGRIFYRRRETNRGRKAGNIEDFISRSGGAYEYCVILDADSLMEGETLVELVRRMEAAPEVGLIQTLPVIVNAQSRFSRIQQFSAAFYSPIFCRGLAMMQGRTGPFWGHNAIVRTRAFAESCGLPELRGRPPFGGHILSHDYVEAALLARAGWTVRVDDDLSGSFEESPENMVLHAKRDRRWCQGNLQHSRLLLAPGLRPWSRFVFLQGILSYLSPVFWLAFLLASIFAPLFAPPIDYFPIRGWSFPVIPVSEASKALLLAVMVFGLLFLPKLLILLDAALRGRSRGFGGVIASARSVLSELVFSAIAAPVFLMFNTRSVFQVLAGLDGGWPAQSRGDGSLTLAEAWAAGHWIVTTGVLGIGLAVWLSPALVVWLLPVMLPMALAPFVLWWSSRPGDPGHFLTPPETAPPAVLTLHRQWLARWATTPLPAVA